MTLKYLLRVLESRLLLVLHMKYISRLVCLTCQSSCKEAYGVFADGFFTRGANHGSLKSDFLRKESFFYIFVMSIILFYHIGNVAILIMFRHLEKNCYV